MVKAWRTCQSIPAGWLKTWCASLTQNQGEVGEIYNIGSQATRSVLDVASDICCAVQCQGHAQIDYVHDRAFNDTRQAVGMWLGGL